MTVDPDVEMKATSAEIDVSPDKDGGVLKTILKEGEVDEYPGQGSEVFVHYTGTLLNGEKFDSSKDRDELFNFKLGEGAVIKGWDAGVATMKKGEVCMLKCAPKYAYGEHGSPPKIPPNATLNFEVELFYWKDEDVTHDEGVMKKVMTKGEGYKKPKEDADVKIHMRGTYQGTTFEEKDVRFIIGEGQEKGVCLGIEKALYTMRKREKVQLTIKPKYGFGEKGSETFGIPGDAVITYEVYLVSFENPKEAYEMDIEEKLETSKVVKEKGTKFFKAGDYTQALKQYERMIAVLDVYKDDEKKLTSPLKSIAYLNAAMCELKMEQYLKAKKHCEKALEIDSLNVKGLYRKAMAHKGLLEYEDAKRDFKHVIELQPTNKDAREKLKSVLQLINQRDNKDKNKYTNMFDKFARADERRKLAEKRAKVNEPDTIKQAAEEAKKVEAMETGEGEQSPSKGE